MEEVAAFMASEGDMSEPELSVDNPMQFAIQTLNADAIAAIKRMEALEESNRKIVSALAIHNADIKALNASINALNARLALSPAGRTTAEIQADIDARRRNIPATQP